MSSTAVPNNSEPEFLSRLDQGRETLRGVVDHKTDYISQADEMISKIADAKYPVLRPAVRRRLAQRDFDVVKERIKQQIANDSPNADEAALEDLALMEMTSGRVTMKDFLAVSGGVGGRLAAKAEEAKDIAKEKAKQMAKKATKRVAKVALNAIPVVGNLIYFLLFTGIGRILLIAALMCICFLFFQVYQAFAGEDKLKSITDSASLVWCAGGTDEAKLLECLLEQKGSEYLNSEVPVEE
ncbi:hypothetical protein DOJK_01864 [Patescibacteria group bacterium]|jgi:hypothetical protein|nr:hypothetical protein [Candidatus Dojkabacteria bacterium]CAG1022743.1 hypothetical protein DOJK_01864 [Patescibacteria group bacterium]